jgi:hypothetical protein
MPLQSSGAISLLDIQNEFGGSNPIGINEYYGAGGAPSSGTISIGNFYGRSAGPPASPLSITLLLMAGGGSATSDEEDPQAPGGGGAGGLFTQTLSVSGSQSITVGGSDGNSSFPSATTAIAGGSTFSGGESTGVANPGGSGGGASSGGRGNAAAGSGTPGQGNPGSVSGGGGGKGSPGGSGGAGGTGYNIADFRGGPALTVAFGGFDGGNNSNQSPAANTGGGATKAEYPAGTNPGGSGIVIVRYPGSTQLATGGNSTYTRTVGGVAYYFHEFTSSGTFTKT